MNPLKMILALLLLSCASKGTIEPPPKNFEALRPLFWKDCEALSKSQDPQGAYLVAEAVEDLKDEAGLPLLASLASHEEYFVRSRAAQAMLAFPKADASAFQPLLKDDSPEVRFWAAAVFTVRGDKSAQKTLEDFLQDPKPLLEATAAAGEDPGGRAFREAYLTLIASQGLSAAGIDQKARLQALLQNSYPQIRYPAAFALLQFGDKSTTKLLQEGLKKGFVSPRLSAYVYEVEPTPASLESALSLYAQGKAHNNKPTMAIAAWALSKAKVKEVEGFLEENAQDASVELRFLVRWALLTPKGKAPPPSLSAEHFAAPPDSMPDSMSDSMPHSMPHSMPDAAPH